MERLFKDIRALISKKEIIGLLVATMLENVAILVSAFTLASLIDALFLKHLSFEGHRIAELFLCLFLQYSSAFARSLVLGNFSVKIRLFYRKELNKVLLRKEKLQNNIFNNLCCENIDALDEFFKKAAPLAINTTIRVPLFLLVVFANDWISGLIFFITVPIVPFILYLLGKVTKNASKHEWEKQSELNNAFYELLRGMTTLKIFKRTDAELEKLKILSKEFSKSSLRVLRIAFMSAFASELLTTLSIAMVAVFIGLRILDDRLSFIVGFWILLIAPQFYMPFRVAGSAFHVAMNTNTAMKAVLAEMGNKTTDFREYTAKTIMPPDIFIRDLSFRYPDCESDCISNVSFKIKSGKFSVLTGSSGIGKSTILKLLSGEYRAKEETIFLNDIDMAKISPEYFGKIVSYVPQEPHIFELTLRENITIGKAYTDAECELALKNSGLWGWYRGLKKGLNSLLGNKGIRLSNGERHRIGLARVLLRNSYVVLLDELTAGLEEKEERELLGVIKREFAGKTVLMVSHRQQVIEVADEIIRLEETIDA